MTDKLSTKAADNLRLARSGSIITPDAATYNLIRLPQYAFLTDAWIQVNIVGSSQTVSVGWTGNGEVASATGLFTTAAAEVDVAGVKKSSLTGKWFSAAGGMITLTVGTTQTTGIFIVFIRYHVIH